MAGRLPCTLPWDVINLPCVLTLPPHFLDVSKSLLPRDICPYQWLFQLFLFFPPSSQGGMNRSGAYLGMTKLSDRSGTFHLFPPVAHLENNLCMAHWVTSRGSGTLEGCPAELKGGPSHKDPTRLLQEQWRPTPLGCMEALWWGSPP